MFDTIARWAVYRRRLVLGLSGLVLVVFAVLAGGAFSALKNGGFDDPASDSSRAKVLLDQRFGGEANLVLLVRGAHGESVDAPSVVSSGTTLTERLTAERDVSKVTSYWQNRSAQLRSRDGTSALVTLHVGGDDTASSQRATTLIDRYTGTKDGLSVRAGGELGANNDVTTQVGLSLGLAEAIAVPITLLLLVLAFGGIVAALLPLAIGLFAVAGTLAELSVLGRLFDVSIYSVNLTTALGLGLAVDYALLIVNRFREQSHNGADVETALAVTLRTAGRTVLFSSATVAVALAAMLIFPLYFLRSFAYAGIGVVILASATALITLPALLATFSTRVLRGRRAASGPESPSWRRIATGVMRRPLLVGLPMIAVLLVLGTPFLHITFATPDDRVLRPTTQARQVGDALRRDFTGNAADLTFAVVTGTPSAQAVDAYATRISALSGVSAVAGADGNWRDGRRVGAPTQGVTFRSGDVQYLAVSGPADASSDRSQQVVAAIRSVPEPSGGRVLVGGSTAALVDGKASLGNGLPWALLWIAVTTFVLLFLFTGSVVLPLKALILNGLSLSAVFGSMVWIFQYGHLSSLLDFTPGPINTSMPILLFCTAFGLSMDYEVFLLSRIKELHDGGADTVEAVAGGLARTGRIVSTAAALLAVTFFAFGSGTVSFLQLFGIGTGIAIVLDATVIRGVLVPAFMRVAGDANWWAPAPLRRLHRRIGLAEAPSPAAEPDAGPERELATVR